MQDAPDIHDPAPDPIWSTMIRQLQRKPLPEVARPAARGTRPVCGRLYGLYMVDRVTSKAARVSPPAEVFDLASCLLLSCAVLEEPIHAGGADGALLSFHSTVHPQRILARIDTALAFINARMAATPWQIVVRARVLH